MYDVQRRNSSQASTECCRVPRQKSKILKDSPGVGSDGDRNWDEWCPADDVGAPGPTIPCYVGSSCD